MASATNYTTTTKTPSNYKRKNISSGFLLLQTGAYLLLKTDGKIKLNQREDNATNYTTI